MKTQPNNSAQDPVKQGDQRVDAVAHRHGLALNPSATSHVADVVRDDDLVIAVCDSAHEKPTGPPRPRLHWSVPDPVRADTDDAFEAAFADLAARV
ncbi:ArsR family transcriptional regulator, partial [Micromonospora sp. NPDC005324]